MIPKIAYSQKMSEKTKCYVMNVDLQDSSTSAGMTEVLKGYRPFTPVTSRSGQVRAKMLVQGTEV